MQPSVRSHVRMLLRTDPYAKVIWCDMDMDNNQYYFLYYTKTLLQLYKLVWYMEQSQWFPQDT